MDLNGVDSSGVCPLVISRVEYWLEFMRPDDPIDSDYGPMLTLNMEVSRRDAEYVVECLRIVLQLENIHQETSLSLDNRGISDEAIDVFGRFLLESPCQLHVLYLWNLPHQQFGRLLEVLCTNTSVNQLCICGLRKDEGASWIPNLLRHKTDFKHLHFQYCRLPFAQILPLLRGKSNLKSLGFYSCRINNGHLLFNDPGTTRLFIDNILLSPRNTLEKLCVSGCGLTRDNQSLMEAIHQNTSIVELSTVNAETRLFIEPILRRNISLNHVNGMLGTTCTGQRYRENTPPPCSTIITPPPCGLWPAVMAKISQDDNSLGATPVFAILRNRLATWITPSLQHSQQVPQQLQQNAFQVEEEEEGEHEEQNDADSTTASITIIPPSLQNEKSGEAQKERLVVAVDGSSSSSRSQSGIGRGSNKMMTTSVSTGSSVTSVADCPVNNTKVRVVHDESFCLDKKRAATNTRTENTTNIKKPKSDM